MKLFFVRSAFASICLVSLASGLPRDLEKRNGMEDRTALSDEHPETFDNRLIEDPKKVEGDIVMSESDPLKRLMSGIKPKFAAKYDFHLWPKGIIPFVVDRSIGNQMRGYIKMAMEHIHKKTCIRFRPAESNDRNYLHIFRGDGCYSHVGRTGGRQPLSLGYGCDHPVVAVHELMHAIGFFHSHMRVDRDNHLNIHWQNIAPNARDQFKKLNHYESRLITKEFDYMSVMLYGPRTFSVDGYAITMSPKDRSKRLVDLQYKPGLSDDDTYNINQLYRCT